MPDKEKMNNEWHYNRSEKKTAVAYPKQNAWVQDILG